MYETGRRARERIVDFEVRRLECRQALERAQALATDRSGSAPTRRRAGGGPLR